MDRISDEARNTFTSLMGERDKLTPSPEARAEAVWNFLQTRDEKFTIWDLLCFSANLATVTALEFPYMVSAVKAYNHCIYAAHYNSSEPFKSALDEQPTTESNVLPFRGGNSTSQPDSVDETPIT